MPFRFSFKKDMWEIMKLFTTLIRLTYRALNIIISLEGGDTAMTLREELEKTILTYEVDCSRLSVRSVKRDHTLRRLLWRV